MALPLNNLLESKRRPISPPGVEQQFGPAVYAQALDFWRRSLSKTLGLGNDE